MTNYKTFLKLFLRFFPSMIVYLIITIGITTALINIGEDENKFEQSSMDIVVVDYDNSTLSKELCQYLEEKHNVKKGNYSKEQIQDMLYYESILDYVVIPKGFEEQFLIQVGKSTKEPNGKGIASILQMLFTYYGKGEKMVDGTIDDAMPMGTFVNQQINTYMQSVWRYKVAGFSVEEASAKTKEHLNENAVSIIEGQKYLSRLERFYTFLPYGFLAILLTGILPVLALFHEKPIYKRISISPMKNWERKLSTASGIVTIAAGLYILYILFSMLMVKDDIFTYAWYLALLNSFVFILVSVAVVMLASKFNPKPGTQISMVTNIITLSFSFLGGIFIPLSVLGGLATKIGRFLPTYWYAKAVEKISHGETLQDIRMDLVMQFVFLGIFVIANIIVSLILGKKEKC